MNQNKEINTPLSMEELLANLKSISSGASSLEQILQTYEISNRNFLVSGMKRFPYPDHLSAQHREELSRLQEEFQRTIQNGLVAYDSARALDELSEKRDKFIPPQQHPMGAAAPMATKVVHKSSENPYKSDAEKFELTRAQISLNLADMEARISSLEIYDKEIKQAQKIRREQGRLKEEQDEKLEDDLEKLDKLIKKTGKSTPWRPSSFQEARSRHESTNEESDDELSNIRSNTPSPTP